MRKYGLFIAIALLVLTNIVVLAGVIRNRSVEPDAVVTLTERELPLQVYQTENQLENTGTSLWLSWNRDPYYGKFYLGQSGETQYGWLDKKKLAELGFDCSVPLTDSRATIHYEKMLPRKAYVVLEYEGKMWDARIDRERLSLAAVAERLKKGTATDKDLKEANEEYERVLKTRSRLFAVDAGTNPVDLRLQYPDRKHYLIVAVKVGLRLTKPSGNNSEKRELVGYIEEVLIDTLHVPRPISSVLDAIVTKAGHRATPSYLYNDIHKQEPSYTVMLYYGKRYEPWVAGVQPINP